MVEITKIDDAIEIAIRIERQGLELYKKVHAADVSPQIKDIFSFLMAEEEKHIGVFRKMLERVVDYKPRFQYPGEYELFLAGAASRVVSGSEKADEFINAGDVRQAINLAINLEMDTILFYTELARHFDDKKAKKILEEIIQEERTHWARLAGLKKSPGF